MNSNEPQSVRDRILEKIEHNQVRMHSRTYFVLKIAAVIALAVVVIALTVFIENLLFFILRLNGHGTLLGLGWRGVEIFIRVFPWWLVVIDVALSIGLVALLRHFQFGYRKPILSIFAMSVALVIIAGFALDRGTPLNDALLRDADDGRLPSPLQSVYQGARRPPPRGSAYRGTIVAITPTQLTLTDPDLDDLMTVILPTEGPSTQLTFTHGEAVFVIGEESHGVIHAVEVHPIDPASLPPRRDDD